MPPRPEALEAYRTLGGNGILYLGTKGAMLGGGWSEAPRLVPLSRMRTYDKPKQTLPRVKGHHRNWLDACKGGKPASSNFDYAGPMTEVILLGNVALRAGKKLAWDGEKMKASNAPEADKYIRPEYHNGWTL